MVAPVRCTNDTGGDGIWPNIAPIGYLNDRKTKTIVIDPKRSPLVKLAFETFATGNYSLAQIREKITDMGLIGIRGGKVAKSKFHFMFQNPIYYGMIRYKGELHEGKHEPLISKALFDRVQEVMKNRSRPKSKSSTPYLYKGVFTCGECGCMVTNEKQKGHVYLRCTKKKRVCSQRYLREEEMNRQVSDALLTVSLSEEDADWMLRRLHARQDKERKRVERVAADIREKIDNIDGRTKRLQEAYLDEVVSLEDFRTTKTELVSDRRSLKENLDRLEDEQTNRLEPVFEFLKSSKQAGLAALTDDHAEKRDWLRKAGSNRRVLSGRLVFEPRGAWKLVATSRLPANNPERRVSVARGHRPELVAVPSKAERAGFEPAVGV